jgi:UDP-N-acetylmuramate dehydrogenase
MIKIDNADLSKYSGYKSGGRARIFIEPENKEELSEVFESIIKTNENWFLLGMGYNTLINDNGFDGVVIRLSGKFSAIYAEGTSITAGAGASISALLNLAVANELGGLEFLAGIPGSIGGAVAGNCGTKEKDISDFIKEIELFDTVQKVYKRLGRDELKFSYRSSFLPENCIVTEAVFDLNATPKTDIINSINQQVKLKSSSQPVSEKSCGCVFKNPEGAEMPAAKMIDQAGLAGVMIGGAQVSPKHVNFIINKDNATSDDIWQLIKKVRAAVKEKYDKYLDLEIKLLGEFK